MINSKKGILIFIGIESIILSAIFALLTIAYFDTSNDLFLLLKDNFLFIAIILIIIVITYLQMQSVFLEVKGPNINKDQRLLFAGFFILVMTSLTVLFYAYQSNQAAIAVFSNTTDGTDDTSDDTTSTLQKGYQYGDEYITEETLNSLDEMEIGIIRNEIYARNGFIFDDEIINEYFTEKDWYNPNPDFSEDMLNDIEKGNIAIIINYEILQGYRKDTIGFDSDYANSATPVDSYNCTVEYKYDKEYVTESFLKTLTQESTEILRNEIYARHGYIFKDVRLQYYFSLQSWYEENPDFSTDDFNEFENSNILIILTHEKKMGWK